jgi:hypothetical protein
VTQQRKEGLFQWLFGRPILGVVVGIRTQYGRKENRRNHG